MYEKGNAKIEKYLFYLMLIFSCIAYVGYYIYARRNGITLLISYSRSSQTMMQARSTFIIMFRFGKDVCAILLLLVEMLSMNKSYRAKVFLGMIVVVSYGTIIALINNLTISTIVSGYRMVVYFCALAMYFNATYFSRISLRRFIKVLYTLLIVNTFIAAIQAYDRLGFNIILIGQGSYRFMGLFPAAAAYGFFCMSTALFAYCIDTKLDIYHRKCVMICVIAFVGCYLSGTRSSMINLLIILFIYVINHSKMKQGQKVLVSIFLALPVFTFILGFSTRIANRGSILENALGGGRITIFINSIFKQPLIIFFMGNGIGAGSNSAAQYMSNIGNTDLLFLDGTFTAIFYQFGMIGFVVCLALIRSIITTIYNQQGFLSAALFGGTIILQCLTTNILEAYALLIMLFISYYTLIKRDVIYDELVMKRKIS